MHPLVQHYRIFAMNALCYRTVFSKRHGTLVAVGEHANSQGKANGAHGVASPGAKPFGLTHIMSRVLGVLTASFVLVTFAWAQPALNALPKSGRVSQGAVQFSQSAQQLQITQSSDRAAVNWQSFDIGAAAKVNVVQPSAQSVLLNRVGGTAPSQIFGQLQANGKVILVNPNGMVFGQDGSVSAAAFTASTLNISDADFMAGNERYTRDGATGAIVNRGLIQAAPGGYVALLGASVSNEGQIVAPQGNVYMAAADAVSLPASAVAMPMGSSGRIRLELTPASINAAVANQKGGTIVTGGGQVYLQAAALNQAMASVLQSGSIDTTGEQGGAVHVLADGGTIKVDGRITANSTKAAAGGDIIIGRDEETGVLAHATDVSGATLISNKGFVETSGNYLKTNGITVKAKDWLLDPTDITIVASGTATADTASITASGTTTYQDTAAVATSEVLKSTIESAINSGTNVTIKTTNTTSGATGAGNITIATALAFKNTGPTDAILSLIADNGIIQNTGATITTDLVNSTKLVNINMDAKGIYQGNSVGPNTNSKGITLNSNITTNGSITLTGTSNAPNGASGVGVNSLGTLSAGGNVLVTGTANGGSTGANTGAITSTGGSVTVIGTSATASGATTGVINAAGNVTITGASGIGASIGASTGATTGAITSGGNVKVTGKSGSAAGVIVNAITGKDIVIVGNSTTGAVLGGTSVITATAGGVSITGTGNNGSGWAITTNNTITATGDIEIKTTSAAKHGVTLGGAVKSTGGKVTIYADVQTSGSGTAISGNHAITANNDINITGKTNGFISINSLGAITSSDGNITVDGSSTQSIGVNLTSNVSAVKGHVALTGNGGNVEGVIFNNLTGINSKSYNVQGTSATSVGVKFNGTTTFNSSTDSVIEGKNSSGATGVFAAGATININSGTGKVLVRNQTGTPTGGMELRSGTVLNTTGDVTFGRNDQANNTLFLQALKATANGGKLTFMGSSSTSNGIGFQDSGGSVVDIKGINGAKILIDGKSTANGFAGVDMKMVASVSHLVTSSGAGGSIEIYGTSKLGKGVNADLAKITSNNGNAINITGTGGSSSDGIYIANAVTANDGGNININGNTATNNGTGTAVSINNNGGAGKVEANGAAGVPAGKITITGDAGSSTGPGSGMGIFNNAVIKGGSVDMTGTGRGAGKGVYSVSAITSTVGGVSIKGTVTGSSGSIGTHIQGPVTAQTDINLEGYTAGPSQGLLIQQTAVTSTAGDITVKGENKWNDGRAVTIFDGHLKNVAGGRTININANTLFMTGTSSVDAGSTGTVNIKTLTPGIEIKIGSSDVGSATLSSQILGIDNGELNRITAGKLVIGDTASTGTITVAAATTTLAQTGNITLQTGGNIAVNAPLTIDSSKTLTLNGAGANSTITDGTSGAIKTSQLELLGANAAVTLDSKLHEVGTLAAVVKSLNFANKTALIVGAVNTINSAPGGTVGIKAKDGVSVTTQTGNLNINEAISNSTSGNVVVGAGVAGLAGELSSASSGDVQTLNGKTITTQSGGKTLVYTGSAAGSGLLSHLNAALGDLKVTGDATQNTDTNFAFNNGAGIIGSTETAQVMFREKVTITNGLVGTTLTKTYGDASTAFGSDAALLADAKAALKTANVGSYTIGTGTNNIVIDKAAVIDSMTGNLSGPTYNSTNTYLKATTHNYGALSSFKYTTQNIVAGNVKVTVAQRALTGLIAQGNTTYGDTLVAGAVNLTNKVGTDVVSAVSTDVSFNIAGKTSGSGKLKAGTHTDVQLLSSLTGADKDNYTFANVKGSYKVDQKALTGSIAQGNTTYGDTLVAGAVNLTNKVGTDVVSAVSTDVIFNIAGKTSGSGKLKAGTHTDVQSLSSLTGADKDNYTFADVKGNYTVNQRALTGSISDVTTVYGTLAAVGVASVNRLDGDDVFANQTVVLTGQAFSTSNNLKAGTYTQSVGAGVGGVDAGNYTFAGTSSSNYVVNRLNLATQIANVSTTYGTAAATGAASITGQIIGDEVSLSGVASLVNSAFSSSNRLRVGAYQQTVGAALGGTDAGNYTAAPTTLANYAVTPKVILASVTAADKVYDGSAAAALLATSVDILAGDTVSVTGLTGNFASKNVARDGAGNVVAQAVTVAGGVAGLGGADGANYVLGNAASVPATSARITPRELIASGITAADKVYDGNTAAVVSVANAALANVVIGDNVGVGTQNAQVNFADKNVARGADGQVLAKAVLVSGLQLQGTDAGNYSLSNNASASAQARITPRTVSLSGNTAQDKVVDGSATAQVLAGSLSGLVSGESLNVNAQGEFEDALVGNSKVVNARFSLVNGSNGLASNYDLANNTAALRASILAFLPASVDPASGLPTGARPTASRTRFSGASGAGAATGVNDEPINTELTEQCSVLNPELCECEDTKIPGVEMCYAPSKVASLKD
jgi:filamentous hemagglutinin family protein